MDNIEKSPMAMLIRGILFEYSGSRLTKRSINQITSRLVNTILMTREGLGLPPEGIATNFSDNEVKGDLVQKKIDESLAEEEAQEKMAEIRAQEKIRKHKEELAARKKAEEEHQKLRTKAIVATPGTGEPGTPEEVGPVAYKTRK